jgi:hypothetical protein
MADIDKALPNIKEQPEETTEDLAVEMSDEMEQVKPGETEITEMEDGSVEVDFDPSALAQSDAADFGANLADFVEEQELAYLGSTLFQNYQDYKNSRKDWEKTYTNGLELLGFKYENRTEPFQGASQVQLTQFLLKQLLSFKHLLIKNYFQRVDRYEHKL